LKFVNKAEEISLLQRTDNKQRWEIFFNGYLAVILKMAVKLN